MLRSMLPSCRILRCLAEDEAMILRYRTLPTQLYGHLLHVLNHMYIVGGNFNSLG